MRCTCLLINFRHQSLTQDLGCLDNSPRLGIHVLDFSDDWMSDHGLANRLQGQGRKVQSFSRTVQVANKSEACRRLSSRRWASRPSRNKPDVPEVLETNSLMVSGACDGTAGRLFFRSPDSHSATQRWYFPSSRSCRIFRGKYHGHRWSRPAESRACGGDRLVDGA